MYSVNNALQARDLLCRANMAGAIDTLECVDPRGSHGHPRTGGYSMAAIKLALRRKGYTLLYLSKWRAFQGSHVCYLI